ncbi:MAG TPA: hypothetical protein VMT93_01355 [Gemmatimonadaceae bacterium]|nr:hypothetical protein [Gemmatimonadaceae bacterium]
MTPLMSLLIPIVVSAVIVFLASSVIHMATPWHKDDFPMVDAQDRIMDAMRAFNLAPGDYAFPRPKDMKDMGSPEFKAKMEKGPVMVLTVAPGGPPAMNKSLAQWFLYSMVVSLFAGYAAAAAYGPGTSYLKIFQVVGSVAFVGYALALWQHVIWWRKSVRLTVKSTIDGLLYACLTAGTFGWLWPK